MPSGSVALLLRQSSGPTFQCIPGALSCLRRVSRAQNRRYTLWAIAISLTLPKHSSKVQNDLDALIQTPKRSEA